MYIIMYIYVHVRRWKAFTHSKIVFEDKLHGKTGDIRPMMIARVHLQHEVMAINIMDFLATYRKPLVVIYLCKVRDQYSDKNVRCYQREYPDV